MYKLLVDIYGAWFRTGHGFAHLHVLASEVDPCLFYSFGGFYFNKNCMMMKLHKNM